MNYAVIGAYIGCDNASCGQRRIINSKVSIDSNRLSRDSCASKRFRVESFSGYFKRNIPRQDFTIKNMACQY
jgi:hypothetical protein